MGRKSIPIKEKLRRARNKVFSEDIKRVEKQLFKLRNIPKEEFDAGRVLELIKARRERKIIKEVHKEFL